MSKPAASAYPYTLQPIPFELSVEDQRTAQLSLMQAQADLQINAVQQQKASLKSWLIVAAVLAAAIAGLALVRGGSTVLFWFMIGGVVLYLLGRFVLFPKAQRYMIHKQLNEAREKILQQPLQPVTGLRLGVQPSGLVMMQGMGRGEIRWRDIREWRETDQYLFLVATTQGQTSSLIIPKRLAAQKLPIDTIKKHLTETVGPAADLLAPPPEGLN